MTRMLKQRTLANYSLCLGQSINQNVKEYFTDKQASPKEDYISKMKNLARIKESARSVLATESFMRVSNKRDAWTVKLTGLRLWYCKQWLDNMQNDTTLSCSSTISEWEVCWQWTHEIGFIERNPYLCGSGINNCLHSTDSHQYASSICIAIREY